MELDFSKKKQVKISMVNYVKKIVAAWDKAKASQVIDSDGFKVVTNRKKSGKSSAAPEDLFRIDADAKKLTSVQSTTFHNLVAKTLFVTKRARQDTSTAIAFLTMRVHEPDVED